MSCSVVAVEAMVVPFYHVLTVQILFLEGSKGKVTVVFETYL